MTQFRQGRSIWVQKIKEEKIIDANAQTISKRYYDLVYKDTNNNVVFDRVDEFRNNRLAKLGYETGKEASPELKNRMLKYFTSIGTGTYTTKKLSKEFSIAWTFTQDNLRDLIEKSLHDGQVAYITRFDHATALFKDGSNYYYFNPKLTRQIKALYAN